ncbi:MerR family transcriptional regulator [Martelella radicis]|uniref:DNA-binding transcriptional MerR regulator n=1 Tax=Martelella radicis TaxID=1397476 RepID=A0A7W6KRE4_9HYPH|nr:helix-turn-helix domain-containing protein [Martelella radicis]MBB4124714.1 DNA-binding transcriptional MerR regulator [Martelella radicis]
MFSIGELSRRTGVKVPTIRYYEQSGLIVPAERSEGNQRRYGRDEEGRLAFIRHARDLGISLDAIRELLELSAHPERPCDRADAIAREHLAAVREKITRLKRLEAELARITGHCDADAVGACYVIRSLADHGLCANEHG